MEEGDRVLRAKVKEEEILKNEQERKNVDRSREIRPLRQRYKTMEVKTTPAPIIIMNPWVKKDPANNNTVPKPISIIPQEPKIANEEIMPKVDRYSQYLLPKARLFHVNTPVKNILLNKSLLIDPSTMIVEVLNSGQVSESISETGYIIITPVSFYYLNDISFAELNSLIKHTFIKLNEVMPEEAFKDKLPMDFQENKIKLKRTSNRSLNNLLSRLNSVLDDFAKGILLKKQLKNRFKKGNEVSDYSGLI